ncbi:MAG: hypothetical protein IPP71_20925 [Bacteroidetes bacterium]|nr:hypothetical protein [Bacteroidota bacterium]
MNLASIIQYENFPIDIRTNDILSRVFIDFTSTVLGTPPPSPITRIGIPEDGVNFPPLSILHLGFSPAATANQLYGLEVGRFTPIGRFGIGNFASVVEGSGSGILPYRKLEIYDEGLDALLNASAPQLRLTFAPGQTVSNGIWTDFQTTSLGNLFINPSTSTSGTAVNGFVGINTSIPGNTLEINSNLAYSPGVIGNSGLILSDMRSGSGTSAGNGKVLTVNSIGEVILAPDNDGGSITACSSPGLTTNYMTKATASTQICRNCLTSNQCVPVF